MEDIEEFLSSQGDYKMGSIIYHCGYGYSHGRWMGAMDGFPMGCGYGGNIGSRSTDGIGNGEGKNSGSRFANCDSTYHGGIKSIHGMDVYRINDIDTVIVSVSDNIAYGYILHEDLELQPCYIAKSIIKNPKTAKFDAIFAHGLTKQQAIDELNEKISSLYAKNSKK